MSEKDKIKRIEIRENGLDIAFRIWESGEVELVRLGAVDACHEDLPPSGETDGDIKVLHPVVSAQISGRSSGNFHGYTHRAGSETSRFAYKKHTLSRNDQGTLLVMDLISSSGLEAFYHMQLFDGVPAVRTWTVLENTSERSMTLEYVTSFMFDGISAGGRRPFYEKTDIYIPYSGWCSEGRWKKEDCRDLGLTGMPIHGHNTASRSHYRYKYGVCGSWSSCDYLPMGITRDRETGEMTFFEIEHSGSWEAEYGYGAGKTLYLALLGPSDESLWWKDLAPGESFTTVPASFGAVMGDVSETLAALTRLRRRIRTANCSEKAGQCSLIFNDYMNCLFGDPTEEKEKAIIDIAADLGCEYYCIDAGWYDKGYWWDRVGEWKESRERFPSGLRSLVEYGRAKGLKMGLWLEIEVMGTACPLADELPDSWFIMHHGKRRTDNARYLLDFRNPQVRDYCTGVIDRLVEEAGAQFFKIDYNVTTGPGPDVEKDSPGQALLEHTRALYEWIWEIYRRHPDLVIENCSSGGQRMDYGILSYHSLQSVSDQTDLIHNCFVAANALAAVTPEQAGMWVYPYDDDPEHVCMSAVIGLVLRPYLSGQVWNLGKEQLDLLKEAALVYKNVIRKEQAKMDPWLPLGFAGHSDRVLAFGICDSQKAYLAVVSLDGEEARVDVGNSFSQACVLYPNDLPGKAVVEKGILKVSTGNGGWNSGWARLIQLSSV